MKGGGWGDVAVEIKGRLVLARGAREDCLEEVSLELTVSALGRLEEGT